jgi:hypothetical protein
MGQDYPRITGRRLSQLKKRLCYDNFSFGKKRYGKLNQAGVPDGFAFALKFICEKKWLNLFRPLSR